MLQPKKWWIGLPLLAVLFVLFAALHAEKIETDIAARVRATLAGASRAIDNAQVAVSGRDVSISGLTLSPTAKTQALQEAGRQEGVRSVTDKTEVPALAKPFVFVLERKAGKITLSGHAPVTGEREKIRAVAARGAEVLDSAAYAAGAPKQFEALTTFALAQLAKLDPGKVTLSDATLSISGEVKTNADYESVVAALKAPPAGATVTAVEILAPRVSPFVWSAAKLGGAIALSGAAPSNNARAFIAAKAAAAGAGVNDETRIASGAPRGDFAAAAAFALTELAKLTRGKVVLSDAALTIEGAGQKNVAKTTIEADARRSLPQGFELAKIDVASGTFSPYLFGARKSGATLTLSGYAPDDAAHAKLLQYAKRSFDGDIVDDITLASGAPSNFLDAVSASLRALARLTTGKLDMSDTNVSLEGEAFHQKAAAGVQAQLAGALPAGFKSNARLGAKPAGEIERARCWPLFAEIASKGIAFDASGSAIDADSFPVVDALAAAMMRCPALKIEISGHTDASGAREANESLSKRRAQAVLDYLANAGVDPLKLTAVGHGGARPSASNDSEGGRAQNRRIEFWIK